MKINLIKTANNKLWPADEESELTLKKVRMGEVYSCDIKLNHNHKLHCKMFAFFSFCCDHYYGDSEAHKDEYQFKYVRNKLTIIAGYCKRMDSRDGQSFELVPLSLKYEEMDDIDKSNLYSRLINAALKRVFNDCEDETIINRLMAFF